MNLSPFTSFSLVLLTYQYQLRWPATEGCNEASTRQGGKDTINTTTKIRDEGTTASTWRLSPLRWQLQLGWEWRHAEIGPRGWSVRNREGERLGTQTPTRKALLVGLDKTASHCANPSPAPGLDALLDGHSSRRRGQREGGRCRSFPISVRPGRWMGNPPSGGWECWGIG